MAYDERRGVLYVADTDNHALREVDLNASPHVVRTVGGTGRKGHDYSGGRVGVAQELNSPWDLAVEPSGTLLIAMAGQHQVWRYDPSTRVLKAISGDGSERNQNGSTGGNTSWAQPSGLALAEGAGGGATVYVADSESSSIRAMDAATGGSTGLVGGDPLFSDNLFRFGDVDGAGSKALLQVWMYVPVSCLEPW